MMTGILDMPMPQYLQSAGVSQSALKKIERSPAHMRAYFLEKHRPSRDQQIGTLVHLAVLQPELMEPEKSHIVRPKFYPGKGGELKPWNSNATYCKEWLAQWSGSDAIVVSPDEWECVQATSDAIRNHPAAKAALAQGRAEQSLFWEDPIEELQCKCRTDWISGNIIADIKTTDDASQGEFARTIDNFGYHVQAAFNLDGAAALGAGPEHFLFISAEKSPPYAVAVYELEPASIEVGRSKYRRWMRQFKHCMETEQWPGYSSNIETISLPNWSFRAESDALALEDSRPEPALLINSEK